MAIPEDDGQEGQQGRIFEKAEKYDRSQETHKSAPDPTCKGDDEIKFRQLGFRRAKLVEMAVGQTTDHKKSCQDPENRKPKILGAGEITQKSQKQNFRPKTVEQLGCPAGGPEGDNKTGEIKSQGEDPGQGNRPDFQGDQIGDRQEKGRGKAA